MIFYSILKLTILGTFFSKTIRGFYCPDMQENCEFTEVKLSTCLPDIGLQVEIVNS